MATISELQTQLAQGQTTALALTEAALARAKAADGEGARVFTVLHETRALQLARASDAAREAGLVRSLLEGLPVSVKDLFDIAGEITRAGSIALNGAAPAPRNAVVIDRLLGAGAVLIGRTNMTEFAFSGLGLNPHYGTPLNPFDRANARIPGGSSSGAAVSVSDGMAVAALGTDTGGSVRIPAALCGLVGFKPTARRVPTTGTLPLSTSLDSIGPIANSVACCMAMDAVLAGVAVAPLRPLTLKGLRLGVLKTLVLEGMDATVADAFGRALSRLSAAGAQVTEFEAPEYAELDAINARGGISNAEAWHWHRNLITQHPDRYDPRVEARILRGQEMTASDYIGLLEARHRWVCAVNTRFAAFDAVLMPTVPIIAPRVTDLADDTDYTRLNMQMLRNPSTINFLDGCALSLPCHAPGEAPVGLMIAACRGRDAEVLAIGHQVETLLKSSLPA